MTRGFSGAEGINTADNPDDDVPASRSWPQCHAITEGNGIDMYSYMVTGGTTPTHSVTVSHGSGDDMMTIASGMGGSGGMGNGFGLKTDDMGVDWLSGHPNLKTGHYMWTLNASDDAAQPMKDLVSWKFRVLGDDYVGPASAANANDPAVEGDGDVTEGADGDQDAWGSFISSEFMPQPFSSTTQDAVEEDPGGSISGLNLNADNKSATGRMDADDDVDVLWVGGLTPNSVLDVKIVGNTETGIGDKNDVEVMLYRHMPGEVIMPADRMEIMGGASDDFDAKHENLACGWYYLEVTGEAGGYTVTWDFE